MDSLSAQLYAPSLARLLLTKSRSGGRRLEESVCWLEPSLMRGGRNCFDGEGNREGTFLSEILRR